jgi:hypothetical protein
MILILCDTLKRVRYVGNVIIPMNAVHNPPPDFFNNTHTFYYS